MNDIAQINVILRSIITQTVPNAVQQHTVSQPAAVQTLPIGTILSGNIVGKEPKGNGFILKTPKGDIFVKSDLPLLIGSKIELIIENSGEQVRARVLTVDGKTPTQLIAPEGAEDELVVATGTTKQQEEELQTYSRNYRNLALADQARRALEILANNITSEKEVRVQIEQPLNDRINFLKTQLPPKLAEALQNVQNGTPLKIRLLPDINLNTLQEVTNKPVVIDLESIPLPKTPAPTESVPNQPLISKTGAPLAPKAELISPVVIQSIIEENASQIAEENLAPFHPKPLEKPVEQSIYSISNKEAAGTLLKAPQENTSGAPIINTRGTGIENLPATNSRIILSGNTLYVPTEIFFGTSNTELKIATPLGTFRPLDPASMPFAPDAQQEITMVLMADDPPTTEAMKEDLPTTAKLTWKEVSGRFEGLDALVKMAAQMQNPQALQSVVQQLPLPDGKMASGILFMLSAISGGNIRKLFGDNFDAAASSAEHTKIARKALDEMAGAPDEITDKNGIRWQTYNVPVYDGHGISQLSLYVSREKGHSSNPDEGETEETRFVFDIKLSHLGRIQVDGLLKTKKNIDVVIRTESPLPPYMKTEMHHLFGDAMELTGMKGSMAFFITRDFVESASPAVSGSSDSEDVVV